MLANRLKMQGLGQQLFDARTARNLTVDDVAAHIHMRPEYITALEEERWDDIGDPLYVRGFLRTYSHFLDLSAERFISEYRAKAPEGIRLLGAQTPEEAELSVKRANTLSTMALAGIAALIVAGGGLLALFAHAKPLGPASVGAAATPRPAAVRATALPRTAQADSGPELEARRANVDDDIRANPEPVASPTVAPRETPAARETAAPKAVSVMTPPAPIATVKMVPPAPIASLAPETAPKTPAPIATSPIRRIHLPPVAPEAAPSPPPQRVPIVFGSPTADETPAQTARRAEINF